MDRKVKDILTVLLVSTLLYFALESPGLNLLLQIILYGGAGILILINITTIFLDIINKDGATLYKRLNQLAMALAVLLIIGYLQGAILSPGNIGPIDFTIIPFGYYIVMAFLLMLVLTSTMDKVDNSVAILLSVPILLVSFFAEIILILWDLFFPPKLRELVPYLDVTRMLILSFTQVLADPKRLETEKALANLGNVSEQIEGVAEGYALRKSIGQGVDIGLTIVVFAFFGVVSLLVDFGIPPGLVVALFGSLAVALSTFAGLFGPFYGLAEKAKELSLRHGNYRAASIYKAMEQLFSIPFMAASTGFLFLDLPPVDAETLEDFKKDVQEQLEEITGNINALLGRDKSAVPKKTQKMIGSLLGNTEASLANLDFRNIREETAREFALTYFQHEFSLKPWERKTAVKEFAKRYHFQEDEGEHHLLLIGDKIRAGQMDDDMVNNIMISAALRGVIQMEKEYQSILEDVELGQTCTGLAFGARQFLKDHYVLRPKWHQRLRAVKNFFLGILAIPIVLTVAFHQYANRAFDTMSRMIATGIYHGGALSHLVTRSLEVPRELRKLPRDVSNKMKAFKTRDKQRNWQIRRAIRRIFSMIWEVLVFPFKIIGGALKWMYRKFFVTERDPREKFEEAVAHAALVAMYDELFKRLVMQTHVSTAY